MGRFRPFYGNRLIVGIFVTFPNGVWKGVSNFWNCQTVLVSKISEHGSSGIKSSSQEVNVIFHVWLFGKCWKTWSLQSLSKLWVCDDQTGKVSLSWRLGIIHKQVVQGIYSPLRNCLLYFHEGLDSGTLPLTDNPCAATLSVSSIYVEILIYLWCCAHIFISADVQILLRIPKYKNQVSWVSFLDAKIGATHLGYIRAGVGSAY